MFNVELPTDTGRQLNDFKRRAEFLYHDCRHALETVPQLATNIDAKDFAEITRYLKGMADFFSENDEPGEIIPEVITIISTRWAPDLITLVSAAEDCWIGIQCALDAGEVAIMDAFDEAFEKLYESGVFDRLKQDTRRLQELCGESTKGSE